MIYNDATVSELLVSIYAPMEETASDLKAIGIDVTINGVAKGLKKYPDVQNVLLSAGSFQNLDLSNVKWGVTDKSSFARAIIKKDSTMYAPTDTSKPVRMRFANSFLSVKTFPIKKNNGKTIASLNISYKRFTHDNCPAIEKEYSPGSSPKKNTLSVV